MKIIKKIQVKEKQTKNVTDYGYSERHIDTLKTKIGKYIIPKSYFEDSLSIAKHLEIELNRNENGLTNPQLLRHSNIVYNHKIEKIIRFKD